MPGFQWSITTTNSPILPTRSNAPVGRRAPWIGRVGWSAASNCRSLRLTAANHLALALSCVSFLARLLVLSAGPGRHVWGACLARLEAAVGVARGALGWLPRWPWRPIGRSTTISIQLLIGWPPVWWAEVAGRLHHAEVFDVLQGETGPIRERSRLCLRSEQILQRFPRHGTMHPDNLREELLQAGEPAVVRLEREPLDRLDVLQIGFGVPPGLIRTQALGVVLALHLE
mmetsp:Transcript_49658/g.132875  ORF Transcript_49658/g.132875 Transcript_49658/m.132875 type:complete len:229 (+) Transcript_49658:300-986(+)